MTDAKKCDRCGAYYMANKGWYGKKHIRIPGKFDNYYDLCENCQDDLDKFMENPCTDTAYETEVKPITIGYYVCRDCVDEVIDLLEQYKESVNNEIQQ